MVRIPSSYIFCSYWLSAVLAVCILSVCYTPTYAAPVSVSEQDQLLLSAAPFLSRYGYLAEVELDVPPTMEQLKVAVQKFQRVVNLPITGQIDANTTKEMAANRCGVPDTNIARLPGAPVSYNLFPNKWDKHHITWSIDNVTADMDSGRVRVAIIKAFQLWANVSVLTFEELSPLNPNADIHLSFVTGDHEDGSPFDGSGKILAHAFPPGDGMGGDVHFDDDETWTEGASFSAKDLFTIAAHEIGHSLGIEHSDTTGTLMYPTYYGFSSRFKLHEDDIAAIQSVYGPPLNSNNEPSSTNQPPASRTPTQRPPVTRPTPRTTPASERPPNPCTAKVDSISIIRGEIFVFKGKWFWRLNFNRVVTAYPSLISNYWTALPTTVTNIDAVVERLDHTIVFFSGETYYELSSNNMVSSGFPSTGRKISTLFNGHSPAVSSVDTAFAWGTERDLYITRGQSYYRLMSNKTMKVISGPTNIQNKWLVPVPLDAVFSHSSGNTFFFQGNKVWRFNNTSSQGTPCPLTKLLPHCVGKYEDGTSNETQSTESPPEHISYGAPDQTSGAQNCHIVLHTCLFHALLAMLFHNIMRNTM